jgi:hypothetical protein
MRPRGQPRLHTFRITPEGALEVIRRRQRVKRRMTVVRGLPRRTTTDCAATGPMGLPMVTTMAVLKGPCTPRPRSYRARCECAYEPAAWWPSRSPVSVTGERNGQTNHPFRYASTTGTSGQRHRRVGRSLSDAYMPESQAGRIPGLGDRGTQEVAATAREMRTVSIRIASRTCIAMMSFVTRDITASEVGP